MTCCFQDDLLLAVCQKPLPAHYPNHPSPRVTSEQKTFTSKWTPTQTAGPVDATGESYLCTSIIPALTQLQLSTFPSCTGFPSQSWGTCAGYFMSYCCSLQYKPTSLRGWIHRWAGQPAGIPGWSSLMQLAQWLICAFTVSQAQTIIYEKHKEESAQMSHACVLFWSHACVQNRTHAWDQNLKNLKNSSAGKLFQISHIFLAWGNKTLKALG